MQTLLSKIAAIIIAPIMFIGGLFTNDVKPVVNTVQTQNVGAVLPTATGVFETSLAAPITSTATSMTLSANSVRGGGSISGYTCLTVDEGSPSAEIICGTVSSTSVTSLTRGVSYADGVTSVAANKFSHRRGANVKITDFPILQILKAQNNGDATYEAKLNYSTSFTFSSPTEIVSKSYVDGVAIAGGADASVSTKGIAKLSTGPTLSTNPIAVGDNDPRVSPVSLITITTGRVAALAGNNTDVAVGSGNLYITQTGLQHGAEKYATDFGTATAFLVTLAPAPTSYTAGMVVHMKATNANTATAPTINVNSLGAKTIVKSVNTALTPGDIAASQIVTLIYDGTNFVLQNPTALAVSGVTYKNGTDTKNANDASTTQNIAHGLGVTPKKVKVSAYATGTAGDINLRFFATSTYNGTTQSSYSVYYSNTGSLESTSFILNNSAAAGGTQVGVITFDATNIIITWTKNTSGSTPAGTYTLTWEAEA